MYSTKVKEIRAARRKMRVRARIFGTAERPRLTVHKSLKNIMAQIIDDEKMVTLAAVSSLSKGMTEKTAGKKKRDAAAVVGEELARRAIAAGVKKVAFDRNQSVFHGRVKALADAARKAGLEF